MRKRTYVLNRFSNWQTATFGKFYHGITHLHTSANVERPLLAQKILLKDNIAIDRLRKDELKSGVRETRWKESGVWKKGQLIRLFSVLTLLLTGLLFHYFEDVSQSVSILYLLAIAIGGYRLFRTGVRNLIAQRVHMRTLMFVPLIGVIILGYWLEGAIFVLLFSIKEAIETHLINIAKRSMQRVLSLAPGEAVVQLGKKMVTRGVTDVHMDDIVVVDVGEKIPVDGLIVSGETIVNEKVITGQSNSIERHIGDEVFAGCLNERGKIFIQVKKLAHETKIAHIIRFVEQAQKTKAPVQQFIENFMAYYAPVVMLLAFFIATLPPLVTGADWAKWVYLSFAILVVACPCSLIISTPIVFIKGLSNAANSGILIKNATSIEELSRIKGVAFDQIGTLTVGKPSITNVVSFIDNKDKLIQLSASISQNCHHPFAKTIVDFAKERNITLKNVLQFQTIAGKGSYGVIDGKMYTIGSSQLLSENHHIDEHIWEQIRRFQREGKSIITVSTSAKLLGFFTLQDKVRPEAKSLIQGLKKERVKRLFLLTEDNHYVATHIAKQLEIEHAFANLLPNMKSMKINKLRNVYSHIAFVSRKPEQHEEKMISHASVNIANGAKLNKSALSNADVVFLQEDLTKLPALIHLSNKTIHIVKSNIFIIFLLKMVALLLVIPNILTLWMAISVDTIATIIILINTLRLMK